MLDTQAAVRGPATASCVLAPEDQARSDLYALLAGLLLQAPSPALLAELAAARPLEAADPDHPLAHAWCGLVRAAATDAQGIADEYDVLFISIGTPLINPYGSYYQAGFLMEKPLAQLREDLVRLGLARRKGAAETEDHLGALCEVMRVLVAGAPGFSPCSTRAQRTFFLAHIAPWYRRCLEELERAAPARFYRAVAAFALAFFALEFEAFEMDDAFDLEPETA